MVPPDGDWDAALARLEDFVGAYPTDRALPDLEVIAERAAVSRDFLDGDERAHKVLLEAIGARPLSSVEYVTQLRTEVELLTLEVEVLSDRMARSGDRDERGRLVARLAEVRARLGEIRDQL